MEEHPLPFAYFNRIAMPEHAVIDRRIVIKRIHGRIPAASHIRIPVVQREEYLLIVRTWHLVSAQCRNIQTARYTCPASNHARQTCACGTNGNPPAAA